MKFKGRLKGFAQRTHDRNQCRIRKYLLDFGNKASEPTKSGEPTSTYYKLAVRNAYHTFKLEEEVKMLHLKEVFDQDLEVWSHSPGLPWRDLGYKTNADIRDDLNAVNKIRKFWSLVKRGNSIRPPDSCAYYTRAHDNEQPKLVWEHPATITFGEAVFAIPLMRALGKHPSVSGFKSDNCRFLQFDKRVPEWLMIKAVYILMSNIDFVQYENYGVADCRYMFHMYKYLGDYFINTTIRLVNGERWQKNSGLAFGSYFAQLIGSICNDILIKWACYEAESFTIYCVLSSQMTDDSSGFELDKYIKPTNEFDINKSPKFAKSIGMEVK